MDNTQKQSVAQQIVDTMAGAGIKNMYAITGDSLNALTDAICDDGRIKFVHMRHEESAAFAADAEAQLTGNLACCAGSSGPGHIHLINGLYDAQRSGAPVLAIASTCPSAMFGTGYFQETDPTLLFSDCTVYNHTAGNAAQAAMMLQRGMQTAVSRKGVAVVGMPEDVTALDAVNSGATTLPLLTERLPQPSDKEMSEATDIFNNAKKVAIYAGCGAKDATAELNALAAKLKAPIATTFKSQLMLTRDCPNYVGHLAYLGHYSAIDAMAQADAILIIGTNFPFGGFFPATAKIVQVDVKAERLGKRAEVALGVRADAKDFMSILAEKVAEKTDSTFLDTILGEYADIRKKLQIPVDTKGDKDAIRPEYFFSLIDEMADDDAIFTVDTGMNCLWAAHYLSAKTGRDMIGSFTHGSMANALPQSIGCKFAAPDRQVIALCGDGGFAMLMGELLTIAQYKLPVKIFVADNRSLAFVRWEMEMAGLTPNQTDLVNPDFGKMASAIGIQAETVSDPANLKDAVDRWLKAEGPALLSVVTETEAASFTFSEQLMKAANPAMATSNFRAPGSI